MPIYEYRCENGHTFEVMQKMTDPPVESCPDDGTPVQRVFHPVAVHFKGSGFYNTDYGKKSKGADDSTTTGGEDGKPKDDSSKGKPDASPGSKDSKPKASADSKPAG